MMDLDSVHTLKAAADRIYNEIEGGWVIDNSRLSRKLVRDKVLIARASILGGLLSKWLGKIPGMYYQECCIDVECKDLCESGDPQLVATIPQLLGSIGRRGLRYVGSPDYKHAFSYKEDITQSMLKPYTPYGDDSREASYTIVGNTLRLQNPPTDNLRKIVIRILAANPFECDPCDEDQVFVPMEMMTDIEKLVKLELSGFLLQRKVDKMNNANPDS